MENEDLESFFTADPVEQPANEIAEAVVEQPEKTEQTTEAITEADIDPTTVEPSIQVEPKMVPLTALQKQRETTKDYAAEIAELRAQIAQLTITKPEAATPKVSTGNSIPDPYDSPAEYTAFIQQQIAEQATAQTQHAIAMHNLNQSRSRAVAKYGEELIGEVADWAGKFAEQNPGFEAQLFAQPDPAEWVIEQKKRHDQFNAFNADPDAFVRARAVELGLANVAPAALAQATPVKRATPPASLIHEKSGNTELSPKAVAEDSFDALFKK